MLKYLATILLLLSLSACIEPIDLGLDSEPGIMVIEGVITDGPGPHKVSISRTVSGQRVPEPVSSAQVFLLDDQDNVFPYFQELPGQHTIPFGAVSTYPGVSYSVRVILDDGTIYESVPERMTALTAKDSVYYAFNTISEINENGIEITNEFIEALIDSDIPSSDQPVYYRWVMEEAYEFKRTDFPDPFSDVPDPCYFISSPEPQRINLFSSLEERTGRIENRLLARRIVDVALVHRYFIVVDQFGLTEAAYTYWNNVRKNIDQSGSIFDVPPATVRGNIRNVNDLEEVVYGYFGASVSTTTRTEFKGEDLPQFVNDPCEFDDRRPRNDYPLICIRCNDANGNVGRPAYF